MSSWLAEWYYIFSFNVVCLVHVQRNSTSLILSTGHTTIEASTLEITSMNMQALIVTTACTLFNFCFLLASLSFIMMT